jgi:alkylhydroperoxidase family enzyme
MKPTPTRLSRCFRSPLALAATALLLGACATTPPPVEQIAVSNAALAHAVGAGSAEFAPTEMALARDKMARANAALAAKDNDTALALAQQAQLDAQLAEAKTGSAKARKSQQALDDAARALNDEMARKQPR